MKASAVVFDLDGTLVDSAADIVASFLASFSRLGLAAPEAHSVSRLIGRPLDEMYAPFAPAAAIPELVAAYRERYWEHMADTTRTFPGVVEALAELRQAGYSLLIATTKLPRVAERLVTLVGLGAHVDFVQGTHGFPAKPAPDVIRAALAASGTRGVAMVGDTTADILAGRAAGLATYGVTWGTHDAAALAEVRPDAVEPNLGALPAFIAQLNS